MTPTPTLLKAQIPTGSGVAPRVLLEILLIVAAGAIVWGVTKGQVEANAVCISELKTQKLDKEVFALYREKEKESSDRVYLELKNINEKLDKVLSK